MNVQSITNEWSIYYSKILSHFLKYVSLLIKQAKEKRITEKLEYEIFEILK